MVMHSILNRIGPMVFTLSSLLIVFPGGSASAQIDRIEGLNGAMPQPGDTGIRFLTPTLIELARINTKSSSGAPDSWNFISSGSFTAPASGSCEVRVNGSAVAYTISGFRRRVLYAPLAQRDLRVDNRLFITLTEAVPENAPLEISTTGWENEGSNAAYSTTLTSTRRSPAIHANQEGYATQGPKQAMVGYYLGSMGELPITARSFSLINEANGQVAFTGNLTVKPDLGYAYTPTPYQNVWLADFSSFNTPGTYRLQVPGLGRSLAFKISDDMLMNFVRTYAQGLYNQRCGHAVELPYSRHTHAACHIATAGIPTAAAEFDTTWGFISSANSGAADNPRLVSVDTQLYPILKTGSIDVSGGHHDAGDYSKYTINSAQLLHHLVFGVDAFANVGSLDNLGLPESGDGKSDILQEAKIEADFLAKMQDDDGGFFFLVYPKTRKYEQNVLPDQGDEQVVWPKNTSATAAAVGALADIASSPLFKQQFPAEAALYLQKAQAGWNFLLNAIAVHGKDGSYQKLTFYGDTFGHNDELAWAAASMFAATGDPVCQQKLMEWYDPSSTATYRWGWWELFESYGCAARSYGFAVSTGKRTLAEMDPAYFLKMKTALIHAGDTINTRSGRGAYGSCLDDASKRQNTAGWFFCSDRAFDATVSNALQPATANRNAVIGNVNYEFGCNPLNLSYVTGAGQRQQREIVHQYAQNDDREFPPSGLPLGNIQTGFAWTGQYGSELGTLTFPSDGLTSAKYPFYDRWADTYNTSTEFVGPQQARSLVSLAAWAAAWGGADQPWKPQNATINIPAGYLTAGQPVTATVQCPGLDLSEARVTWECGDQQPWIGTNEYHFTPVNICRQWLEAEVVLPDGRRFTAVTTFGVKSANGDAAFPMEDTTVALYHFDGNFNDASPNGFHLIPSGRVERVSQAAGWMAKPSGEAVRFYDIGDKLTVSIPDSYLSPGTTAVPLTLEAWICPLDYKAYGKSLDPMLALVQAWNSKIGVSQDMWIKPSCPSVSADGVSLASNQLWSSTVKIGTWQHLKIIRKADGTYECWLDETLIGSGTNTAGYGGTGAWVFTIGNFNGYVDEIRISGAANHGVTSSPGSGTGGTSGGSGSGSDSSTGNTSTTPPPNSITSPFNRSYTTDASTIALYNFNGNYDDSSGNNFHLTATSNVTRIPSYSSGGISRGEVVRLRNCGDSLTVTIPDSYIAPGASELTLEAWIYPRAYKAYGAGWAGILSLYQDWDSCFMIGQDKWLKPAEPYFKSGATTFFSNTEWSGALQLNKWQHLRFTRTSTGLVSFWLDGVCIKTGMAPNANNRANDWSFRIGDIDADIDDVRISKVVRQPDAPDEFTVDPYTVALYHFNGNYQDSGPNGLHLTPTGNVTRTSTNLEWMNLPTGEVARFANMNDGLTVSIPNSLISPGTTATEFTVEARIFPRSYKAYGISGGAIIYLYQNWDSSISVMQDKWLTPAAPQVMTGGKVIVSNIQWNSSVELNVWHKLKITRDTLSVIKVWLDDVCISTVNAPINYGRTNDWFFKLGDINADIDEVRLSNIVR